MPRIQPLSVSQADDKTAATLNAVNSKLGMIPNLFATFAQAPAALNGFLKFSEALGAGRLTARQREIVALAIAQENACHYCLSAHTAIGKGAGLSEQDIRAARAATASDPKDAAIADFARALTQTRAVVSDRELAALRAKGVDDGLIVEIVANVALNLLTNYTNHVAGTEIDFPVVDLKQAA